nr:hypothetical protein [Tanacetum cinerariifolium]
MDVTADGLTALMGVALTAESLAALTRAAQTAKGLAVLTLAALTAEGIWGNVGMSLRKGWPSSTNRPGSSRKY